MKPLTGLILVAALAVSGCSNSSSGSLGSNSKVQAQSAESLIGEYRAEIAASEAKPDDPMGAVATGLANLVASNIQLEVLDADSYRVVMMGFPIEGKLDVEGDQVTLTPEKVMGMTKEEFAAEAKRRGQSSGDLNLETMHGVVEEEGQVIRVRDKNGDLVFRRKKEEVELPVEEKVSAAEKPFVGKWVFHEVIPPKRPLSEEDKQEAEMAKAFMSSAKINLRADNTFVLFLFLEREGTWKSDGEGVLLTPAKTPDAEGGSDDEPIKLTLAGDKLRLGSGRQNDGIVVFRRQQ